MFAGYRVESLIGRGGMGVVYRATDLSLGRPVALKMIAPELAQDQRFRDRFLREPRLAASLDHPNVVPIHEAGERDGQLYLAMRFVEGSDLRSVLEREGKLAPQRALAVLAQIADALDTAHRRGLVHRDVRPANVLLDEDEHAYLTDFGVTKQVGGASTDTGRVVGTLDYLAPEQIRGEAVDGRTDCYALACVLYECLSGAPPFRRDTEAEMLWAHMHEQPAPLPGYAALDPVFKRGLAKERDERYGSCAELIEDARRALGLGAAAAVRRTRVPSWLRRRRRTVLAAGLFLLAGAIAAVIGALTTGDDSRVEPLGNGVAAIDAEGGIDSFTEAATAPSNIAVGEGAVWALNTEDDTVSRIDPKTKRVVKTFESAGRPSDLAAGAGAVWVGNGGGRYRNFTASISRVDPDSAAITRTVTLPDKTEGAFGSHNPGLPRIAVGAGAVWAVNPDDTLSRIDPETGKLVAPIDVGISASTIAAGEEGVWFLSWEDRSVMRLDPRTNRVAEKIPLGIHSLSGIAVGAGSVWVTAQDEGLLWRIEPGTGPSHTIDVGAGATYVAFGDGAVWTGNYLDGVVSRIAPRTNRVTARVGVGTAQALAAGAGSAWAGVAGTPSDKFFVDDQERPAVEVGGGTSPASLPDQTLSGKVVFGGYGCPADPTVLPQAADYTDAELGLQPGDERILLMQRGPSDDPSADYNGNGDLTDDACFPGEKAAKAFDAGWDAIVLVNRHFGADDSTGVPNCGSGAYDPAKPMVTVCTTHAAYHELFGTTPQFGVPYPPDDAPAIGAVSVKRVRATSVFDGWGYVSLFRRQAGKVERIDSYAIPEALDPAFAFGFGDLSIHEVALDPGQNLAYSSYYAGGVRVFRFGEAGIDEVGHHIDDEGNNFWGVETFVPSGVAAGDLEGRRLFAGSDRDHGIFIFRYTGG
jgi:DNA-binding beta-propeller fold protein YncE